ncbi:MAG: helix-turn-helix domain-containing protein [Thermoplasmata archaeon]
MDVNNIASEMRLDRSDLLSKYMSVARMLAGLGLSEYEARAYLALVALGSGSASVVARIANIPRTSVYKVMARLGETGYVRRKPGRPASFTPVDPSEVSKRLVAEVEECFKVISSAKEILSQRGVPQLVYTIMGKERVLQKIGEMMDKAEHTFVMSCPSLSEVRRTLGKQLSNCVSRGVQATLITSPFVKAPPGVRVVRRSGLIATDVISDGKTALIAAPDLTACGYTDNEALSRHLEEFLKIMAVS